MSSKTPVLGVTTEECLASFVNMEFPAECIKYTISKCLGYAIILGSFALKVPQIGGILKAKSSEGMILSALYSEMLSFACVAAYNVLTATPLSTYAESLIILAQNMIIVYLCWGFSNTSFDHRMQFLGAATLFVIVVAALPQQYWPLLMVATTLASVFGRCKQIIANFQAKSTGVLSLTTTLLQVGGTAARVFTTLAEVDDFAILTSFLISFLLNVIILGQIFVYGDAKADKTVMKAKAAPVTPGSTMKKRSTRKMD
jgi:mannose-P-dolichol utilization defect protein 1